MDSKEETPNPISELSSGSSPSTLSSYVGSSQKETLLNSTIASNGDSKGAVSEDEGYVSGNEEFEPASDKPVVDEIVGEGVGEENSDASEKVESLPISGVILNDEDDVEKGDEDIEGDEGEVGKDDSEGVKFSGVEGSDRNGDVVDSVEKLGENSDDGVVEIDGEIVDGEEGKVGVGELETKVEESKVNEESELLSEPQAKDASQVAVVEPEESEFSDAVDVKTTPEGDSVVDAIQVDVAAPGVVVVGEMEENDDVVDKPEEEVVSEVAVIEPEKLEEVVSLADDEVQTSEEVAVVDASEETLASVEKLEPKEAAETVGLGDVTLTSDGDSVVDTIQVGMVGPGVAVVGDMEGKGVEKIEGVDVPLVSVGGPIESADNVEKEVSTRDVLAATTVDVVESSVVAEEKVENSDAVAVVDTSVESNDSVDIVKKPEVENASAPIPEAVENGIMDKIATDGEVEREGANEIDISLDGPQEIGDVEDDMDEEVHPEDSMSDGDSDGMIFGSSEAAKKFIEELERESVGDSNTGAEGSLLQSRGIDGQIVTDSEEEEEEEGETDDEGDGKELFDNAALAALLKAASRADSDGGSITITSQDGSRLFSVERPAGLGSSLQSLRPAQRSNRPSLFSTMAPSGGGVEAEDNLSEEEKKKLEKLQQIRVKFLRLVHRLGLSPEESVAAQVLYRLALLGGRQNTQTFNLDAAKRTALQLEAGEGDDLDFSINILVLGKAGVGKSATINSVFGEEKAPIDAFETGTASAREISGLVDGVKVRVIDTPGLRSSVMEQGFNRGVLSSVKKFTKKSPPDVVLYVDRLDAQSRDLNDLPLLKTVTTSLNSSIWRSAIVTLTHAASAPPDGPSGAPLSYEVFVSQRSHVVQQSIGHAVGDLRMMSPSLMNPVSLVENHPSCRKNREGHKILPNGQIWRPQLLLLCYSMKILSEASSLSKPQDPFDHRKLFGMRPRSPPLPYMLSSMLQSRSHPKLQSDQGGDGVDSDIDLDEDLSDSEQEGGVDEYDQLPPFKPLKKSQMAKLTPEQRKAYFEEYDYRVKLLQKKQWREELRRMREMKKNGGKDSAAADYGFGEDDGDSGAAAPVAVPLPDMALPPSFDGDNPAYRFRFLEPTSQFLARPVLDNHGWDHDCGYDGVNLEHSLAIASRFPAVYTVQVTKDKKDFSISLDSSVSAKLGDDISTMAGFDIQSMGKQLAYIVRGETKFKNVKKHKATGGLSFTFLGENVVPGVKIEDQVSLGKQYSLVGSAGAVRSQQDTAYGANFELQRRELDYPIGQVQSTLSVSVVKWRGDLALGLNSLAQFSIGRNSKVAVRAGINNKLSGQITVRTSSSDHLSLALTAVIPTVLSIYKKFFAGAGEKYPIY